jgi:LPXTG-site transpeptidase (sortase) family protein
MFSFKPRQGCRTRHKCKHVQTLAAAALVLAIMLQFMMSAASTGAQRPACPDGQEYNPLTGVCEIIEEDEPDVPVATGEPMPTEEPTEEPTMDPTEAPEETPEYEPTVSTEPRLSELFVHKWTCEPGYDYMDPANDFSQDCTTATNGVRFSLYTPGGQVLQSDTGDSVDGAVYFGGLDPGTYTIEESVPDGIAAYAVLNCKTSVEGDGVMPVNSKTHSVDIEIAYGQEIFCDWYNFPVIDEATPTTGEGEGYADLVIYKWECPAGYDPLAQGAFPMVDCTTPLNGVTFTLDGSGDFPIQTDTGDSQDGLVMFGGQEVGDWVITETLPDGYESAFVYECNGITDDSVHPTPLQLGNVLELHPTDGDNITCNWFNIPESDFGSMTVYKYVCDGEAFTSETDCELYEGGVEVRLTVKDPVTENWTELYVATTDEYGRVSWTELPAGSYGVEEIDREPCYIDISAYDEDKNIAVQDGEETIVKLYNCGWEDHEPNKDPVTWPNTGALQVETECPELSSPNATPDPSTEDAGDAADDSGCTRGKAPVSIAIDSIDVNADVETLETVNGAMQAPTGPQVVSWYKETARPGETGNVVLAGHLNYWGVPEGVFFDLKNVEEGDVITLHDIDGAAYQYAVTSVEQVASDVVASEVLAPVEGQETLTLITCGGEWDSEVSEYDERTIVKAVRIPAGQ